MNDQQVAAYLHMDLREVQKLASRGQLPCRKVGGKHVFNKGDVDHWVERQMPQLDEARLAGIERGVSRHHGFKENAMVIWPLIPAGGLRVPLAARTRNAVIRSLAEMADGAGLVCAKDILVQEITQREALCTTALVPGVALPHPRHPLPYDISASFVVVGLTASGIPFGSVDGSLTRLFFLICCKDDRTHLHVLARLGRMLQERSDIENLLASESPEQLGQSLLELERRIVGEK